MIEVIKIKEGWFIRVDRKAAMLLIQSLSGQIIENSPNTGRWEGRTNEGKEFTIAVIPEKVKS